MLLNICSLYLPPNEYIIFIKANWENYWINFWLHFCQLAILIPISLQLSSSWGKIIETLLRDYDISLLNTRSYTHFSSAYGTFSAIDLSISSSSIYTRFSWRRHTGLCSYDHFPIILSAHGNNYPFRTHAKWQIHKADWPVFRRLAVFDNRPN